MFNTILIQPLANGLIISYQLLFENLGLAIIGFSLFLRFVLSPLTKPYMDSMKKMRDVAPQINKLKKKYKNDKTKLAQAQSDLYKENGVKPGAGCLPYLLQIVILIAFFRMFMITLSAENPTVALNELLYTPFKLESGETINTDFLWLDLTEPDVIQIPGLSFLIPGILLIVSAVVQFFSAKITAPYEEAEAKVAKKTPEQSDDFQASMQKSMIYTFPLFTLIFGMKFPSGLALYWFVFSLFQTIQQYRSQGWGGLTPWLIRVGLVKSGSKAIITK